MSLDYERLKKLQRVGVATYAGATNSSMTTLVSAAGATYVIWPIAVQGIFSAAGSLQIRAGTAAGTAVFGPVHIPAGTPFYFDILAAHDASQTNKDLLLQTGAGAGTEWVQVVYRFVQVAGSRSG